SSGIVDSLRRYHATGYVGRGFKELGISPVLCQAAEDVFGVATPTPLQRNIVSSILSPRRDVIVRQETGSGKTFAMMLSLLTLALESRSSKVLSGVPFSIMMVPNRELALQINEWSTKLLQAAATLASGSGSGRIPLPCQAMQPFVSGIPFEDRQTDTVTKFGMPGIVVGTPRRLHELFVELGNTASSRVFRLAQPIEWLVVDEVDQILRLPGKYASKRQQELRRRKPKPGQIVIEYLVSDRLRDKPRNGGKRPPHLIFSSATANQDLRKFIRRVGWMQTMTPSGWPKVLSTNRSAATTPSLITHSCLVIQPDGSVHNLQPERLPGTTESTGPESAAIREMGTVAGPDESLDNDPLLSKELSERDGKGESLLPIEPGADKDQWVQILGEAVASIIEAETAGSQLPSAAPTSCLVFTRSGTSVQYLLSALRERLIMCHDLMARFVDPHHSVQAHSTKGNNTSVGVSTAGSGKNDSSTTCRVYVTTEQIARGIDIPNVSLVIVLDTPESTASYIHMAGRTGRFGRPGKVVTVIPAGHRGLQESRMRGLYKHINASVTRLEYID
ncbi:hypothetical protein EV182_000674, partial [Spiromyces aspiralis]